MPIDKKEEEGQEEVEVEVSEETTEEAEATEEVEQAESESSEEAQPETETEEEADEVVVTIGDEEPKEPSGPAPSWVRELRKAHKEMQKENKNLRAQLEEISKPAGGDTLQAKPKLEDFEYDTEKYEQAITGWYDKKRELEAQKAEKDRAAQQQQEAWQNRLSEYEESKTKLKVPDFEDAEAVVTQQLDQTQQGIIIHGAENAPLVMYALGKNPERSRELAEIKDPVKFAFAVAKLEKDLKVRNRKAPPPPEKKLSGAAPSSGSADSTLERLREEAARTGDYTKVARYKRQKARA